MNISIIAAPTDAQQIFVPQPPAKPRSLDYRDQRILDAVRDSGPINVWLLVNGMNEDESAQSRAADRAARLALWSRVKRLIHQKLLFYSGRNRVALTKPDKLSRASSTRRVRRQVRNRRKPASVPEGSTAQAVSAPIASYRTERGGGLQKLAGQQHQETRPLTEPRVVPAPAECASQFPGNEPHCVDTTAVSAAARALAQRPRNPKRKWSGWLPNGVRAFRGMPVLLPSGESVFIFGVRRGRAVVTKDAGRLLGGFGDGPLRWAVLPSSEVVPVRNAAAALLGSRKLGRKERPSPQKQAAARRNGLLGGRRRRSALAAQ